MPELPEVETIVRTLTPQIHNARIVGVEIVHAKSLQAGVELLPLLSSARIGRVFRRAKLLLVEIFPVRGPQILAAFHLKMTGRFFVHPKASPPLRHTRIIFTLHTKTGGEVRLFFDDIRTFGYCRLMKRDSLASWPFWANLGPEPLETPPEELARRFATHRSAIKGLLLNQSVVAGIGNIYADESLFRAGIAPTVRAGDVALPRLVALAEALRSVLLQSISECGSSIRDYRDANGNAGAFQNSFAVYGRSGKPCIACGSALQTARVAGRKTVFCPMCQR